MQLNPTYIHTHWYWELNPGSHTCEASALLQRYTPRLNELGEGIWRGANTWLCYEAMRCQGSNLKSHLAGKCFIAKPHTQPHKLVLILSSVLFQFPFRWAFLGLNISDAPPIATKTPFKDHPATSFPPTVFP